MMEQKEVFEALSQRLEVVDKLEFDDCKDILHGHPEQQSDADLLLTLYKLYKRTVIPPCRVCGGVLEVGSMGGGPTVYACSQDDGKHYSESAYRDYMGGGDGRVLELIGRYALSNQLVLPRTV